MGMPELPEFGELDGRKVRLDNSVWDLSEADRARILVEMDFPGGKRVVRPFRFCSGNGVVELGDGVIMT